MKLAIRGHDFGKRGEFSLTEKLDEFCFDGVQLVPYKTYADISYSPDISELRAREIADELSERKKEVFLLGAYFNCVHSDKQKVKNGVDTFKRYLELAKTFNTTVVGSETGSFNDDKWTYNPLNITSEALDTVVNVFSELALTARENGVFVGMEGASGHVCNKVSRLMTAINRINDRVGFDRIKVIFDIYNYLDNDNYADYLDIVDEGLETFGDRIHCFHMKDCVIVDGKLKQCAVGRGMFDYEKLLSKIKKHNPNATLILEGTTGEDIAPSRDYIKNIWKSV